MAAELSPIRALQPDQWQGMPGVVLLQHGQWGMGANRWHRHRCLPSQSPSQEPWLCHMASEGPLWPCPKAAGGRCRGPQIQARPNPAGQLPQALLTQDGKTDWLRLTLLKGLSNIQ